MTNLKQGILLAAFIFICLLEVSSQSNMNVNQTSGINSFSLKDIRKLTFIDGKLNLTKASNETETFYISNIGMIDFDDKTIITSDNLVQKDYKTILYPSLVIDYFSIKNESIKNQTLTISIFDLHGKKQLEINGNTTDRINISQLHSGVYICRITYGNKTENLKFIKQ